MANDTNNGIELAHSEAFLKFSNVKPTDVSLLNNELYTTEEAFIHKFNDDTQLEYSPQNHVIKVNTSNCPPLEIKGDIIKFNVSEKNNREVIAELLIELYEFSDDYSKINLSLNNPEVQLTILTLNPVAVMNIFEKLITLSLNMQEISQNIPNSDNPVHKENEVINQQNTSLTFEDVGIENHNNFAII